MLTGEVTPRRAVPPATAARRRSRIHLGWCRVRTRGEAVPGVGGVAVPAGAAGLGVT
jgi:hypothetical protein